MRSGRIVALLLLALVAIGCAATGHSAGPVTPLANATPLERKLAENPNDIQVNFQLGTIAESGGDFQRAEQYYLRAEALGMAENTVGPRIVRALVAARRYDEALDRCRHRLAGAPNDRPTRFVASALLIALERPKEAERELNTLMRTEPADPQSYLALGRLYRDDYQDRDRARAMFEKFLTLVPSGEEAAAVRFELAEEEQP